MTVVSFRIEPLPTSVADRLRAGATTVVTADEFPGFPCRACLRDAAVGDEVVLVSHDPFAGWEAGEQSPYRSAGPVFVHLRDCSAEVDTDRVPVQLARRQVSVRAFDRSAMMVDARVVDGAELDSALETLSARDGVARVFVHNAGPGCFAASVTLQRTLASGPSDADTPTFSSAG